MRRRHQAPDRRPAHAWARRGRRPRDGVRRRQREPRRTEGGAQGRRHGLRDRRRGRWHRHRRRARDRRGGQAGDRRADRRRGHTAVRLRGQPAPAPVRRGHRPPARAGGHPDRDPEREAAGRGRAPHQHPRGVPRGRQRPAPGRPGHHRPDHHPRPDQPRLRRRAHDHARRRLGPDGHRRGQRREPRRRGGQGRDLVTAAGAVGRGRHRHPAEHHRRPGPGPVRGQRGGRDHPAGRRRQVEHHLRRRGRRGHRRRGPRDGHRHRLRRPDRRSAVHRGQHRPQARAAPPRRVDGRSPAQLAGDLRRRHRHPRRSSRTEARRRRVDAYRGARRRPAPDTRRRRSYWAPSRPPRPTPRCR